MVYVDDIMISGSDHEAITSLINNLNKVFALKYLGELNLLPEYSNLKITIWKYTPFLEEVCK